MATEAKKAPEQKQDIERTTEDKVVDSARQFWNKNSKSVLYAVTLFVLIGAGFIIYKNLFVAPEEEKAADAVWKAQQYFQADSFRLALNGDGVNQGFLRVSSKYSGTK